MKNVMVEKGKLLEALKRNREKHAVEYQDALEGWAETARIQLADEIDDLKTCPEEASLYFNLPKPESYVADYDRAIAMVEMDVRETLEMSESDFSKFVLDQWGWKESFDNITKVYNSNIRRG